MHASPLVSSFRYRLDDNGSSSEERSVLAAMSLQKRAWIAAPNVKLSGGSFATGVATTFRQEDA
jgi:hypothetical protein